MTNYETPDVAFLGVCERAHHVVGHNVISLKHHFLGLSFTVMPAVYPLSLKSLKFVFAIFDPLRFRGAHVSFVDSDDQVLLRSELGLKTEIDLQSRAIIEDSGHIPRNYSPIIANHESPTWSLMLLDLSQIGIDPFVKGPGNCKVFLEREERKIPIGVLTFAACEFEPLSPDLISAIKSNPRAGKVVRYHLTCNGCSDSLQTYAAIERNVELEGKGILLHTELPEHYRCTCGSLDVSLYYLKKNLHGLLGRQGNTDDQLSFSALYDKTAVSDLCLKFDILLSEDPKEETIHAFIKNHELVLSIFSPQRLWSKAAILNKCFTDFAVLNSKHELILVELEKTSTRILKVDGGQAAEVTHAFDQVNDWLKYVDDHKAAVLEGFDLNLNSVSRIRGAVVAGRDAACDAKSLRAFKGRDFGRVEFFTYDDLANHLLGIKKQLLGT